MSSDGVGYAITMLNWAFSSGAKTCEEVREFCRARKITKGELREARKELEVFGFRKDDTWYWDVPEENRSSIKEEWPS